MIMYSIFSGVFGLPYRLASLLIMRQTTCHLVGHGILNNSVYLLSVTIFRLDIVRYIQIYIYYLKIISNVHTAG